MPAGEPSGSRVLSPDGAGGGGCREGTPGRDQGLEGAVRKYLRVAKTWEVRLENAFERSRPGRYGYKMPLGGQDLEDTAADYV